MLKFGLVSYSHLHILKYAPAINQNQNVKIVAIAGIGENQNIAKEDAKKYNSNYYDELDSFFSKEDLDAIYVGTSPDKHLEVINLAAKNGINILCDKPIATNLNDAEKIIEITKKNKVKLMVPFNPRYQVPVIKAKEIIDSGELGEVQYIYAVKYGKIPLIDGIDTSWFFDYDRAGVGGFGDIGIHAIDGLRFLVGSEAKKVYAKIGTKIHNTKVDDIGQVIMEFENGAIACLSSGWANPQGYPSWLDVKFEILGENGAITIEKPYQDYNIFDNQKTITDYWYRKDIELLVDEFIQSIMENREPAITNKDAYTALEILLAAYESSRTGKEVIL